MGGLEFLIILALLLGTVLFVTTPVRGAAAAARESGPPGTDAAELEAAREAKYREIRDAELDHLTGKLSDEDYAALDATLRAEAIAILDALDRARAEGAGPRSQLQA